MGIRVRLKKFFLPGRPPAPLRQQNDRSKTAIFSILRVSLWFALVIAATIFFIFTVKDWWRIFEWMSDFGTWMSDLMNEIKNIIKEY